MGVVNCRSWATRGPQLQRVIKLALEEFCRGTGFVLSNEVWCLMPPEMDYLEFTTSECLSLSV